MKAAGQLKELDEQYGQPDIFLCTEFEGEPKCNDGEMSEPFWAEPDSIDGNVFPPFAESLKLLNIREISDDTALTNGENNDTIIVGNNDICKDANGECRAKDPSKCPVHGNKGGESGTINPSGANEFKVKGFRNKQKLNNHFKDHQAEYPGLTKEQYAQRALELVESPIGNGIKGHADNNGQIVRYDTATNDFAKGHPEKGINTFFKPIDGQKYYDDQRYEDLVNGGQK